MRRTMHRPGVIELGRERAILRQVLWATTDPLGSSGRVYVDETVVGRVYVTVPPEFAGGNRR